MEVDRSGENRVKANFTIFSFAASYGRQGYISFEFRDVHLVTNHGYRAQTDLLFNPQFLRLVTTQGYRKQFAIYPLEKEIASQLFRGYLHVSQCNWSSTAKSSPLYITASRPPSYEHVITNNNLFTLIIHKHHFSQKKMATE